MAATPLIRLNELETIATGRQASCFINDISSCLDQLTKSLKGQRVLVIGGAGSIGAAVTQQLARFPLRSLHVLDQNENGLAEVVRRLRSQDVPLGPEELRTLPLDFGSPITQEYIRQANVFDTVMNFAAIKHVRSEKDTPSLLQMLDTNVWKQFKLLNWLHNSGFRGRYYSVSTDKAANPVSLMGASKRLMEHVAFLTPHGGDTTSARFANVAFSDGSLLHSFIQRIAHGQPLAVPKEIRRYFISHTEAAHISLLAWLKCSHLEIAIPRFNPQDGLVDLQTIADKVVRHFGFKPCYYDNERIARSAAATDIPKGLYPVLVTPPDTSGEKPYEEFIGDGEISVEIGLSTVLAVKHQPPPATTLERLLDHLSKALNGDISADRAEIIHMISECIPQFHHFDTGLYLDARM
jgi:FlaA1/EpsC-like NDP-sugar epimerase